MSDLHARLLEQIEQREHEAKQVLALFEHPIWPPQKREVRIAERDLRGLAEDRDVLARHAPSDDVEPRTSMCVGCMAGPWINCDEIRSQARRHGIPIDP